MRYVVQEYTSLRDGKIRFRVLTTKKRDELYEESRALGLAYLVGHFYGSEDGVDYEQALMIADNERLERRLL